MARMELRVARQKVGQILITAHTYTVLVRGEISAAAAVRLAQYAEILLFWSSRIIWLI